MHSSKKKENIWRAEWGCKTVFSHGDTNSQGVCVLFKPKDNYIIYKLQRGINGRVLCVQLEIQEKMVMICNIYAPNEDEPSFFLQVDKIMNNFDSPT